MPLPQKRIGRRKKVVRISSANSTARIFGRTPRELLKDLEVTGGFDSWGVLSTRILALQRAKPRYFLVVIKEYGKQELYEIIKKGRFVSLRQEGTFSADFAHRTIYEEKLHGRGIGFKALKTNMALLRSMPWAPENHEISTRQVSTIQMLLKRGYKLDGDSVARLKKVLGVTNKQELLALLSKTQGDEIKMYLQMEKPLHAPKKK